MAGDLISIDRLDVRGKRVLVRADLNVPMTAGEITDATRIERFAPTVAKLADRGGNVVILTHMGRPDGEKNPMFSTRPVAEKLQALLSREVKFVPDCVGPTAELATGEMGEGEIAVMENVRFYKGETDNETNFALRLSINGDVYVNDAFSCSHRAHASTHAIAAQLPAFAGHSLLAEVGALSTALESPERPMAALVGGAKVSSKIDVLLNLVGRTDILIIGGGMANTFLAAQGYEMGNSLVETDAFDTAREIMAAAQKTNCRIVLPVDLVVANEFKAGASNQIVTVESVPAEGMALDVGPATVQCVLDALQGCKTLLWNGPMGAFEIEPFGQATFEIARAAAKLTQEGKLLTVAGGGDTVAALNGAGIADQFTYISTAGGAFLEWLEGKDLPGIEALKSNKPNPEEI